MKALGVELKKANLPALSPSHTVGLEPFQNLTLLCLMKHSLHPTQWARNGEVKEIKTGKDLRSPSHTVGLKPQR